MLNRICDSGKHYIYIKDIHMYYIYECIKYKHIMYVLGFLCLQENRVETNKLSYR